MKWESLEQRREYYRNWREKNKEKRNKYSKKYKEKRLLWDPDYITRSVRNWRNKNPEANKAHKIVFVAVRNGSILKELCFCGEYEVEAHHDDYSKPLEVIWLCKPHHVAADILRRKKLN